MADLLSALGGYGQGLTVEVDSTVGPAVTLHPLAASEGPSPVLSFLRPKVTVRDAAGNVLATVAPGGDPGEVPPWGAFAVLGLAAALVGLGWYIGSRA